MILCQFNSGCMGCCGHDFGSIAEVREAIRKNTIEFKKINNLRKFRDRADKWNLRSGVCRNIIDMNERIFCPLHPKRNGDDLRKNHCDTGYFCETAKKFRKWDAKKQKRFLKFISEKKLDNIEYSIKIDDGELMKEFLKQQKCL